MKIIENPDWIDTETDTKSGVLYLVGRCLKCNEHLILKWKGAGIYKCPYCKKEIVIRRDR